MLKVLLALLFLFQEAPTAITSPQSGEILRGQVNITGNLNVTNFASAELAFAYVSDPTSTWFTIQAFSAPPADAALAVWDTTLLTDGDYALRLRVDFQDGTTQEVLVTDLKIRNNVPTATVTANPTATAEPESTPVPPLATPTDVPASVLLAYPTPTALPVNPATLTVLAIYSNLGRGTAAALVLFFLIGILLRLRRQR